MEELLAIPSFSLENVTAVSVNGILQPDSSLLITAPLQTSITNDVNVNVLAGVDARIAGTRVRANSNLSLKPYVYTVADQIYGKYAGAYRTIDDTGRTVYKSVPATIQAVMPDVHVDDLYYNIFRYNYTAGQQADLPHQVKDRVAYPHSQCLIGTERIFQAVKDHGYSTYADTVRGLWGSYAYNLNSGLQFTDDSGNPVQLGEMNADGVLLSPYYIELHKIFDTKDITIFIKNGSF